MPSPNKHHNKGKYPQYGGINVNNWITFFSRDLRPSHTEGMTGRQPPVTSKFSLVFGSLPKVADHHVMVSTDFGGL